MAIDSVKTMRSKPLKSSIYASIAAGVYTCCKNNPDQRDFNEQFKNSEQQLSLVTVESQNPATIEYLKLVERSRNNDTLRITSIGLFSIMWLDDNASALSTYDATCDYLKPEFRTFYERIIDVGWMNVWWNLQKTMKDYDVNY